MNNSSLSLSRLPAIVPPIIPSLSHGKATNAIKSNVRKTIALNDMFVARSSPPSPLPPISPALYTRLPFNYSLHIYMYARVRVPSTHKGGLLHAR